MSNQAKSTFFSGLQQNLDQLRDQGLYKPERVLASRQGSEVVAQDGSTLINMCANNYLGLSGEEWVAKASIDATEKYGYGLSSVRFICGTQTVHKQLEQAISKFLGTDDTILYAAAFDANGGVFEPLFDENDAIISDALNHASIIDGIRLCKAARFRYAHNDMADLEAQLQAAADKRHKVIVTDGVFSMDGTIAQLDKICDLADKYGALVMIDECHASGFMGATGRGTHEHHNVMGRADIITGTLGKALGGAMGGFTSARKEVIDMLRQKSRPYLFSNTLAPSIAGASLAVLERLSRRPNCATACTRTPPTSARRSSVSASPSSRVRTLLFLSCCSMRPSRRNSRHECMSWAFCSAASSTRWSRWARRACVSNSPPRIPARSWTPCSKHSNRRAQSLACLKNKTVRNQHGTTTHPRHRRQRPNRQ